MALRVRPRDIDQLVEQQVKRWMAEQASRRAQSGPAVAPARPVVTISREAGANGTILGRLVADKLGFHLWDQELVQRVAEQSGASEALFAAVDERARGAIQDLLAAILIGDRGTEAEYLASLLRVIYAVAQHGSAVLVGRGAQFVIRPDRALRVRVVGPIESRVREFAAAHHLSEREARGEVDRIDRERLGFVRHHFHRNAADPSFYDLAVNAIDIPPAQAAEVVVAAYHVKFAV